VLLEVELFPFEPMVYLQNGSYTGFSIEVWDQVINEMNTSLGYSITYHFISTDSVVTFNQRIFTNQVDVGISGLSITQDQAILFRSSSPYRMSVITAIMTTGKSTTTLESIWLIFKSPSFLQLLLLLLVFCIPAANFVGS